MPRKNIAYGCAVDGCPNKLVARGWCGKHYCRWLDTGDPLRGRRVREGETPESRFWDLVDKRGPDECWEWQGHRDRKGYGKANRNSRGWLAHRLAWMLANGREPQLLVLHSCDNPPCCNPKHLREGTAKENTQDAIERGQMQRGERNGRARLTTETVKEMKNLYRQGSTIRMVAGVFGITYKNAQDVQSGRTWKHVT